jgi:hypothetical protein
MLIDQLNRFLEETSFLPSSFWVYKYYLAKKSFEYQLTNIIKHVNQKTKSSKDLKNLINAFKKEDLNEYELAQLFQAISGIFQKSNIQDEKIESFQKLSQGFIQRAKTNAYYKEIREDLVKSLPEQTQNEHDSKLFQNEGIGYCLEYYLSVYKQLEEIATEDEKQIFINSNEINLGFGKLPGLKQDSVDDESLIKFIYLILDSESRDELIEAYYKYKIVIHKETNSKKTEEALKRYILSLLRRFKKQGVKKLTSTFLIPYGKKPQLTKLIELFK